ncbi:MAG: hypothetical protein Q8K02_16535 [Flavobacterium sp.]|nr:hypothetical protein [Flavobacterium sp.]
MKTKHLYILISGFTFLFIAYLYLVINFIPEWQTRANFGDMFGALSALFSGIALAGIIYTIFVQLNEIKAQRKENSEGISLLVKQIEEIQRHRSLQSQPFPILEIKKFVLEKPRFYYTPPEDSYSVISRYTLRFSIKNKSSYPAINVIVKSILTVPKTEYKCESNSRHFNYVDSPLIETDKKEYSDSFLYVNDDNGFVLDSLRHGSFSNLPQLYIRTTFKNILGVNFAINQAFILDAKNRTQEPILKNWLSEITSYKINFSKELEEMKKIISKNEEKWQSLFDLVKEAFNKRLISSESTIEVSVVSVPTAFNISILSDEEYEKEIKRSSFSAKIPTMATDCIVMDK